MHAANLLAKRAELTPQRIAVVELETDLRISYEELNRRANRLANFMRESLGLKKGDRVSIIAKNSLVYLDLFYGLAKIGGIFAPFNWRLTARELAYVIKDLEPRVLIVEAGFEDVLEEMGSEIDVEYIVGLRGAEIEGCWVYEDGTAAAGDVEPDYPKMDGETPYCILYTSGTTGYPKGAVIPHRQVLFNCINTIVSWGLSENDISPVYTPLFHAGGLFAFLTPILYVGGRIVLARKFDPVRSLEWILDENCTVILGVPTLFQMWMESDFFHEADFSSVRFFISGGAKCPLPLMERWRTEKKIVFRQGYGLTEVGANCFTMTDEESVTKAGSVGKPVFHSQMKVIDPETKQEVPAEVQGELLIKGPHVCTGYWKNSQATREAIIDGWFFTGDMVHRDQDGFFYIDGRYKDMIKSGGENIYAAEVESIIRDHPAVKDAALIGMPDEIWGEVGLMIITLEDGQQVTPDELVQLCHGKIAKYKIPKGFAFTDALPYSAYGKVEKDKLREIYLGDEEP